jgi:hypothetical protein
LQESDVSEKVKELTEQSGHVFCNGLLLFTVIFEIKVRNLPSES